MREFRFLKALVAVTLTVAPPCAAVQLEKCAETNRMPSVLNSAAASEGEAWVSLSQALLKGTTIDFSQFSGISRTVVEDRVREVRRGSKVDEGEGAIAQSFSHPVPVPSDVCPAVRISLIPPPEDTGSFVRSARAVVIGRIEGVELGFAEGADSTLLKVRVQSTVAESEELHTGQELFVVMPFARFAVGGLVFCSGSELPGDYRPSEGDGVLMLLHNPPLDEKGQLYPVTMWEIAFFDATEHRLILPAAFREGLSVPPDLATPERRVRRRTSASGEAALETVAQWLEKKAKAADPVPAKQR